MRFYAIAASILAVSLIGGCDKEASQADMKDTRSSFSVYEASIQDMQTALAEGRTTSQEIVGQYLDRMARYNGSLNAVMALNPNVIAEAMQLDYERSQGYLRGPLHGIPVALKDIINTTDMPTTGGMLAFKDYYPPYEATVVSNLRAAGAIIIAKTTVTELANSVSFNMPGNYSAVGGHGYNPYDPRLDPREGMNDGRGVMDAGSSSSGNGTAANFWAGNVGTETAGSILWPSSQNMLVGIKPTVGRISRHGIMPVSLDQDTVGPMTKTVADAAIMLGAMEGQPDPYHSATGVCTPPANHDYTPYLQADALRGMRIGIPRAFFFDAITLPGQTESTGGVDEYIQAHMTDVINTLRSLGATVVEPADLPSILEPNTEENFASFELCFTDYENCSSVLFYGTKRDLNNYFASLGPSAPVASMTELREFNAAHAQEAIKYGQGLLDIADQIDLARDEQRYIADRQKDLRLTATNGIDAVMNDYQLDALLFPGADAWDIGSRPGYPSINVPVGFIPALNADTLPAGFDPLPNPFGVSFTAKACDEGKLISIAYAFEQATKRRIPPPLFP